MFLDRVSILIKTGFRDGYLRETIDALMDRLPETQIVVVDDGPQTEEKDRMYDGIQALGHAVVLLPEDSGFGAKSNAGVAVCTGMYVLIGSDDFDFRPPSVREGIEKLVEVLDEVPYVDIASGRVRNYPYEGWLHTFGARVVEEAIQYNAPRVLWSGKTRFHECNLTVNYSLIRKHILGPDKIHWDDEAKIGEGEHGAFFLDVMRAGHRVAWVEGVNIEEQPNDPSKYDPRYPAMRARARSKSRTCFDKRGVVMYTCFGGAVDYFKK